jgi:hypothetical protein
MGEAADIELGQRCSGSATAMKPWRHTREEEAVESSGKVTTEGRQCSRPTGLTNMNGQDGISSFMTEDGGATAWTAERGFGQLGCHDVPYTARAW